MGRGEGGGMLELLACPAYRPTLPLSPAVDARGPRPGKVATLQRSPRTMATLSHEPEWGQLGTGPRANAGPIRVGRAWPTKGTTSG